MSFLIPQNKWFSEPKNKLKLWCSELSSLSLSPKPTRPCAFSINLRSPYGRRNTRFHTWKWIRNQFLVLHWHQGQTPPIGFSVVFLFVNPKSQFSFFRLNKFSKVVSIRTYNMIYLYLRIKEKIKPRTRYKELREVSAVP